MGLNNYFHTPSMQCKADIRVETFEVNRLLSHFMNTLGSQDLNGQIWFVIYNMVYRKTKTDENLHLQKHEPINIPVGSIVPGKVIS